MILDEDEHYNAYLRTLEEEYYWVDDKINISEINFYLGNAYSSKIEGILSILSVDEIYFSNQWVADCAARMND